MKKEVKERGRLYYDQEDGWYLQLDQPGEMELVSDLVRDFHGKEVEIRIKVLKRKK